MGVSRVDHLYAETLNWDETAAFWKRLGFAFVDTWGEAGHRAGRLESGGATVVLAEVTQGEPRFSVFFAIDEIGSMDDEPALAQPPHDTHWGTRMAALRDPDGRVHSLEEMP